MYTLRRLSTATATGSYSSASVASPPSPVDPEIPVPAMVEITPRKTALSQFDHTTGDYVRKPLSRRIHIFGDGRTEPVQRDLYSAFLASCCGTDTLDICQVQATWPAAQPLLRRAMARDEQPASGQGFALPPVRTDGRAGRPLKRVGRTGKAAGAYPDASRARAAESLAHSPLRTPRLAVGRFREWLGAASDQRRGIGASLRATTSEPACLS